MKKIIFFVCHGLLLSIFICTSSLATASISNNNIGSVATASDSNSKSILSNNSGTIGAESNANPQTGANNTTKENTDTSPLFQTNASKFEGNGSNSDLPENATP